MLDDKRLLTIRPWSLLINEAIDVLRSVYKEWTSLLENQKTNEQQILKFLKSHSGFFFIEQPEIPLVISELRLGSEYRIDFVKVVEGYSSGTKYVLIEMESPNDKLFRSNGRTSAKLATAIDQLMEWKRWIRSHRYEAQKLFPSFSWRSDGEPFFDYQIIMGRREEKEKNIGKISSLLNDQGIKLVSYDRLTDKFTKKAYSTFYTTYMSTESRKFNTQLEILNKAASPFLKAITDKTWRSIIQGNRFSYHIIPQFFEYAIPNVQCNTDLLEKYDNFRSKVEEKVILDLIKRDFNSINW